MFPFQLLGCPLADHMLVWLEVSLIGTPAVGVKTANTKRFEQRFQCQKRLVLTATKDRGYDPARLMIQRLPQPSRLLLAADKGPHFVQLSFLDLADHHREG